MNINIKKSYISLFNLFYIFVRIVWQPFQVHLLKADGAGRTIVFLSILAVLLNLREFWRQRKIFLTPAFLCWVALLAFSMWNAFSKGFYSEWGTFAFLKARFFHPFILLVIAMLELNKDKQTCLKVILVALGVYLLIGLLFMDKDLDDRLMAEGLGNLYPLHAVAFLFVSAILYVEEKMEMWLLVVLTIGISAIIVVSQTRKAFGAEVILLVGIILSAKEKRTWKNWITIIVSGILLIIGIEYIVNNTDLGSRLNQGQDEDFYVQLVENERLNSAYMSLLGDRAVQYEMALELHHEYFWTGIGLMNYMDMSGGELVLHSEYMVQLCENGTIGFVLLMLFYVLTIIALIKNKKNMGSKAFRMVLFGLAAVLFINFTAWTYNANYVMIIYAIILTYAYSKPNHVFQEKSELQIDKENKEFSVE